MGHLWEHEILEPGLRVKGELAPLALAIVGLPPDMPQLGSAPVEEEQVSPFRPHRKIKNNQIYLKAKASCRRPKNIKNVKSMKHVKIGIFKNSSF